VGAESDERQVRNCHPISYHKLRGWQTCGQDHFEDYISRSITLAESSVIATETWSGVQRRRRLVVEAATRDSFRRQLKVRPSRANHGAPKPSSFASRGDPANQNLTQWTLVVAANLPVCAAGEAGRRGCDESLSSVHRRTAPDNVAHLFSSSPCRPVLALPHVARPRRPGVHRCARGGRAWWSGLIGPGTPIAP